MYLHCRKNTPNASLPQEPLSTYLLVQQGNHTLHILSGTVSANLCVQDVAYEYGKIWNSESVFVDWLPYT